MGSSRNPRWGNSAGLFNWVAVSNTFNAKAVATVFASSMMEGRWLAPVKKMGDDKMNFWEPCRACRVIAGAAAGRVVTETEQVLVLINPFPLSAGHALVVPRRHIENLYELPDELAAPTLSTAARVARGEACVQRLRRDAQAEQRGGE